MKNSYTNIIVFFLMLGIKFSQNFPLKISRVSDKLFESRVRVIDERPTSCGYYFVSVYFDDFTHTSDLLNNRRFSIPWTGVGDYNIDDQNKSKIWVGIDDSPISRGEIYCEDGYLIQKLTKLSNSFTAIPYPNSDAKTYSFTTGVTNSRFLLREGVADALLHVDGKMACRSLYVLKPESWADEVFDENYTLMDLKELLHYIKKHKHLPEIPSENDIKEKGYDRHEINRLLLKKMEELTLYIIELENKIKK